MYRQPQISKSSPLQRLPAPVKRFLSRLYWLGIDLVDFGVELVGFFPSHSLRLLCYRHLFVVQIGKHSSIHRHCRMFHPSHVTIGNATVINRDVLLDGRMGVVIHDNVSISEGVIVLTLEHDLNNPDFENRGAPVVIEDYVFIGTRAILLPGVTIGKGSAVAAGAIVTHDVAPYTVVAGVPAKKIGTRNTDLRYSLNYRRFMG